MASFVTFVLGLGALAVMGFLWLLSVLPLAAGIGLAALAWCGLFCLLTWGDL